MSFRATKVSNLGVLAAYVGLIWQSSLSFANFSKATCAIELSGSPSYKVRSELGNLQGQGQSILQVIYYLGTIKITLTSFAIG